MGFAYVDNGKIVAAGYGGIPDSIVPYNQSTIANSAQQEPWVRFFTYLRQMSGSEVWTVEHITEVRPVRPGVRDISDILSALQYAGVDASTAVTLADWLGNNCTYSEPFLMVEAGLLSLVERQANAILNPEYLTSNQTGQNVEAAVSSIASYSPAIHAFIVYRIRAAALKIAPASYAQAYEPLAKTAQGIAEAAGEVSQAAVDLAKAAASAGANIAKGATVLADWIVPIGVGGGILWGVWKLGLFGGKKLRGRA